jgi:O-methyltransferase
MTMGKEQFRNDLPSNDVLNDKSFNSLVALSKLPGTRSLLDITRKIIRKPFVLLLHLFLGRVTYFMPGLITTKNCDFMKDPEFIEAYNAAMKQEYIPDAGTWVYHVNQWAAFHAKQLKGDFVECGVNKGTIAMSNITYINFKSLKDRKYYLFDTFCGADKESCTEDEYLRLKDAYPDCYQFVAKSFKKFPNVVIVKGPVPKTLSQVHIDKVAYLSLDMNCALPELEALKYFWPKLVPGGIVVLDDYGWPTFENQKEAADNFASSVKVKVLSLPTGQGIIIKPN